MVEESNREMEDMDRLSMRKLRIGAFRNRIPSETDRTGLIKMEGSPDQAGIAISVQELRLVLKFLENRIDEAFNVLNDNITRKIL